MGISVVICCYNSNLVIEKTLEHLQNQVFEDEKWEVIVVDNNSNDNTSKIAEDFWATNAPRNVQFRLISEPSPGLSYARVKGMKAAQYPIISFVDDDNHVPSNWISYLTKAFQKPEVGILGCTANGIFEQEPPEWYEKNKNAFATGSMYDFPFVDVTEIGAVYGAGMTLRKEIFTKLNEAKWQPLLSGRKGNSLSGSDDTELVMAAKLLGYRIFYTNEIQIGHYILSSRLTWDRLKKLTEGFGSADVFMLSYEIVYNEIKGRTSFILALRKYWWFNYIGKKLSFAFRKNALDKQQRDIFEIRMNSFCETILEKKRAFKESIPYLRSVFNK